MRENKKNIVSIEIKGCEKKIVLKVKFFFPFSGVKFTLQKRDLEIKISLHSLVKPLLNK